MDVLVTGCGGFLGNEIVRQLLDRGDRVVGISRSDYPPLRQRGMEHRRGDLVDASFTAAAVADVDAVIHTAAIAGVWGPWSSYFAINKTATDHVINACRSNGIGMLVFTSSPSVTFDGLDQSGVDEGVPYASRWLSHYSHTKALAEQAALAAHDPPRLSTLALRPHLIWGEDDPHIFPRLLQRARQRRLRIVGRGDNLIDTVHVVNAAAAHLDALDALATTTSEAGGRPYFITQDEPVECWDWISKICRLGGAPPPTKRISFAAAYAIGGLLETMFRATGRASEPPMTRFMAAQLARDHYFDISAAKTALGYRARISMDEGLQRLSNAWRRR